MRNIREANARWIRGRARFREWASHAVPSVAVFYPFEILALVVGFIMGVPILLGFARPTSLILLLPVVAYVAYSAMLVIGSLTITIGLRNRHPLVLASGLQLLGGSYIVYGLAVVALGGWAIAWGGFTAFGILGLLCLARSSYYRRLIDIQTGAATLGLPREPPQ